MATTRVSIAELLETGIALTAVEAVAIARAALSIDGPSVDAEALPRVPLPDRIFVEPDGTMTCQAGGSAPTIPDVARLLRDLLPSGNPGVPGGLRYAIARALGEVDAPPFESTDDFSNTLARFQTAAGPQVGRGVLARIDTDEELTARVRVERRRPKGATVSNLRHALREADSRLYEQQRSAEQAVPVKSRTRRTALIGAGVIGAVALFAAGAATRARLAPDAVTTDTAAEIVRPLPGIAADIVLESPARQMPVKAKVKSRYAKPAQHATSRTVSETSKDKEKDKDKGFFARLRLGWLKRAFS
jgi:hypothetical protein